MTSHRLHSSTRSGSFRKHVLFSFAAVLVLFLAVADPSSSLAQSPVPDDSQIEKIGDGFRFTEGPIWYENALLFTDIPANRIHRWTPDGETGVYLEPSGHANGLAVDPGGRLLLARHDGQVSRLTENRKTEILADAYNGKRLNSPNDLTVAGDGTIYFTDPPYGVDSNERELDFSGVYRIDPDGSLSLLTKSFSRPNGIVLSPDETTLYVNDSAKTHVRAFDVDEDGSISNERIFAEPDSDDPGPVDGMTVDASGNLYTTGPGGIWIYSSDGEPLDRISVPKRATNVTFGGRDDNTLYITARSNVFRIRLKVEGAK